MGEPGYGHGLPQPGQGQLTIGDDLLGYHNNNHNYVYYTHLSDHKGCRARFLQVGCPFCYI